MFAVIFLCGNLFLQITGKIAKKQKFCATQRQTDVFMTCYLFVSSTYVQLLSTENYRCYTVYQYFDSSFFIILLRPMCSHTFSTLWQPCRLQNLISKRFLWQWNKKCIGNFRYKRDKIKRYLFAED